MKNIIIFLAGFQLLTLVCNAQNSNLKNLIDHEINNYISNIESSEPFKEPDGVRLIFVMVIKETDSAIQLSINHEHMISSLKYIDPNFTYESSGSTIFVRAINLSEDNKARLNLKKCENLYHHPEIISLKENSNLLLTGIFESVYLEIINDSISEKAVMPSEQIEGDLWIYSSELTKKLHEKEVNEIDSSENRRY